MKEIETDKINDDRPKEIQDLEERFGDGLDTFTKQGLQDFEDLKKAINAKAIRNPDNISKAKEKEPSLFQKLNCFPCMVSSSSTDEVEDPELNRIY